ncbi:DUF6279 family lipoprotein [Gammaproteobacteria bacterium]|nr:DUF6279 family lipoprotein [Gammaproteobacteria bacterium]MDC0509099.1 DUF6279 family lipoprotein [Gammaproteobacteria bacterium]MDC0577041.1 DUF6279 family lipoprotein [Gammaproteobacteria bacterium]MDC0590827.1 DUF6279 family lipoprotein [Gammaproteobacteria bacterium]MDC3322989.1 DUF6279 family lipoprotein [Gammaproteobacteria bacterium]
MVDNFLKSSIPILLSIVLSSCSIAGTWVYERLDNYLADYFKEYADFSKEQNNEIEKISKDYLDWFSANELPRIKLLIKELKDIKSDKPEIAVLSAYEDGQKIFRRTNSYFEEPIINFSKTLDENQIIEIGKHFEEIREKREEEQREEEKNYLDEILENYVSGFDRVGIILREDQITIIRSKLQTYIPLRAEWSSLQEEWVNEFIQLLKQNKSKGYEEKMLLFLQSIQSLGDGVFENKADKNQILSIEIISYVFSSSDERQMTNFRRNMDVYLKSINRILSKRSVN